MTCSVELQVIMVEGELVYISQVMRPSAIVIQLPLAKSTQDVNTNGFGNTDLLKPNPTNYESCSGQ